MFRPVLCFVTVTLAVCCASQAFAQSAQPQAAEPQLRWMPKGAEDTREAEPAPVTSRANAGDSMLLPSTVTPGAASSNVWSRVVTGYDGATDALNVRSATEARLLPFVALRLKFDHGPGTGPNNRFAVSGRAQLLNTQDHGLDASVLAYWQPNDFRDEGLVGGGVLLGRSFGQFGVYANALAGSDPEGDDTALQGRLAFVLRLNDALRLGLDNSGRFNLSADEKRFGTNTRQWELQSLPALGYTLGPVTMLAEAGLSAVQIIGASSDNTEQTHVNLGLLALGGAGVAF